MKIDDSGRLGLLRTLLLEDHAPDAELMVAALRRFGFEMEWKRVSSGAEFMASVDEKWDLILADFALPQFDALKALEVLRDRGLRIPLIVVTGAVSEEVAVECIKQGAADYLLKDRLTRLGSAVAHALESKRVEDESARGHRALKENEQRLRALIEHSSNGTLLLSESGDVCGRYNDLFDPADGWYTDNFLRWMAPEDRKAVLEVWAHLGNGLQTIQFRISNGTGQSRRIEAALNDLRKNECVGAIVVHYRDVTEKHQLEEQFRHVQKMEAVGQLAVGLGHDFNNLLTIIRGHSELLTQRRDLPEPVQRGVREIRDACHKASRLTRELLAFSRKDGVQPKVLDANQVVSELAPLLKSLLGERFALRLDLEGDAGWVRIDEGGLEQVIMNLVLNARDAMGESGCVTITSRALNRGGEYRVMFAVRDTGCGMSEEIITRIFEPFYTTKDVGKGTGLGLSSVYAIVTKACGTIVVESELGRGSTFRLVFPCAERVAELEEKEIASPMEFDRANETILLVDDDSQVRNLVEAILEPIGYRLILAKNAEDAIEKWRETAIHIDLLLTDVRMPGMKGPELARVLSEEKPGLRALFMSGHVGSDLDPEDEAMIGSALISKPFTAQVLVQRIREALHSPRGGARVLVVDDSAQIRNLLRAVLEKEGYGVEEAGDGKHALALVRGSAPDVVITDLVMPETEGIELIQLMRSIDRDVKIIAMSGAVGHGSYLEAASVLGADATMSKPFAMDSLIAQVKRLSGQRAARRRELAEPLKSI